MKINSIGTYYVPQLKQNKQPQKQESCAISVNCSNVSFMSKTVSKSMPRFYRFNFEKLPTTVRKFLEVAPDKYKFTPMEAFSLAFAGLAIAESISDVNEILYPDEELFNDLKDVRESKATTGLLGISREFKDLYQNGILKNGEDLTLYFLKKIFMEIKTVDDINKDLENDLDEDIKDEFIRRNNDNKYIANSTLNALGIYFPKCWSSLLFTKKEFVENHSICVSLGLLGAKNKQPGEQTSEKSSNRYTPEDYEDYYIGGKDVEIVLGNSSEDDSEHIKKAKKYAHKLHKLTPEKRTEFINKMMEDREPLKYSMIDAWNHSIVLIMELSDFLKSKQHLRPADFAYDTEEFSKFQSQIMTEFWAANEDLAEEFGHNVSRSIAKVEEAIKEGRFEELKKEIENDREYRRELVNMYKAAAQNNSEEEKVKIEPTDTSINNDDTNIHEEENIKIIDSELREEFIKAYNWYINKDSILPVTYVKDMADLILEDILPNAASGMVKAYKIKSEIPEDFANMFSVRKYSKNYEKMLRLQRALEAAISKEMFSINHKPEVYAMECDEIIDSYRKAMHGNLPGSTRPDVSRVQNNYKEFRKDLTDKQLTSIANRYFTYVYADDINKIKNYINLYGRSALILFSDDGRNSNSVKICFNEKFLRLMPDETKNICIPFLSTPEDILAEQVIQEIRGKLNKRFAFMPNDFLYPYTYEVASTIRTYNHVPKQQGGNAYSIKSFEEHACGRKMVTKDNEEYYTSQYIKIPKMPLPRENKIKVLAAEQALADELYRVSGDESLYELEVEELMNLFEMCIVSDPEDMAVTDKDGKVLFKAEERPNSYNVYEDYKRYRDELTENEDSIFKEDDIQDCDKLIDILNAEADNNRRVKYIRNRLDIYLDEPNRVPVKSISELKR